MSILLANFKPSPSEQTLGNLHCPKKRMKYKHMIYFSVTIAGLKSCIVKLTKEYLKNKSVIYICIYKQYLYYIK